MTYVGKKTNKGVDSGYWEVVETHLAKLYMQNGGNRKDTKWLE